MRRRHFRTLLVGALALLTFAAAAPAGEAAGSRTYRLAVVGDIPYGAAQEARLPGWIDQINADRDVRMVAHLGDIKSGSTVCSDAYFASIRGEFDRFRDPLVYTPGDNEWTDCHRTNNGGYDPLERLDAVRKVFFDEPGSTLGRHPARVDSQRPDGYPENVRFRRADVEFAAVHIVGSNNGLAPWTGSTAPSPAQSAEVLGRTAAAIGVVKETFAAARADRRRAVVLLTQADMFDSTVDVPTFAGYYAFQPIVATIAREARAFRGPVYLINGDSHVYNVDTPLSSGSRWLELYDVDVPAPNLTRITVDGSTNADGYLKVSINPRGRQVLTWQRVPFDS